MDNQQRTGFSVNVAGLKRDLPLFEVAPGVRIAIVNILGDTDLIRAAARELAGRIQPDTFDIIATAEAKSIPLIYALAVEVNAVVEGDLPALNKLLLEGGLGKLDPGKRVE